MGVRRATAGVGSFNKQAVDSAREVGGVVHAAVMSRGPWLLVVMIALLLGGANAQRDKDKGKPEGASDFCDGALGANRRVLTDMRNLGEC